MFTINDFTSGTIFRISENNPHIRRELRNRNFRVISNDGERVRAIPLNPIDMEVKYAWDRNGWPFFIHQFGETGVTVLVKGEQ